MKMAVATRGVVLMLGTLMATGLLAAEPAPAASKVPVLTRAQVDALLATPEKIVVIDLRRPDEQASKGAFPVFLSIQADDLEKYLAYIPRERQVLAVSNHSRRSGQAAELLAKHGFHVAGVVGAQIYEEEGGKLNKVAPP
jgi:rhodanese-related sulfurtransferase